MTNTLRATTAMPGSADDLVDPRRSEDLVSSRASTPLLSSASRSSRQGSPQAFHGLERSDPRRMDRYEVSEETIRTKPHVAILDSDLEHAATLADRLCSRQLSLTTHRKVEDALEALHREHPAWDILVVNVSDASQPWLAILRRLQEACLSNCSPQTPLFLCTSTIKRDPQFQLSLERIGVRFVYER